MWQSVLIIWLTSWNDSSFQKQYYNHAGVLNSCWLDSPSWALLPWTASLYGKSPFCLSLCRKPIEIPGTGSHSFACHINLARHFPPGLLTTVNYPNKWPVHRAQSPPVSLPASFQFFLFTMTSPNLSFLFFFLRLLLKVIFLYRQSYNW